MSDIHFFERKQNVSQPCRAERVSGELDDDGEGCEVFRGGISFSHDTDPLPFSSLADFFALTKDSEKLVLLSWLVDDIDTISADRVFAPFCDCAGYSW
jgi:hypothetical protein